MVELANKTKSTASDNPGNLSTRQLVEKYPDYHDRLLRYIINCSTGRILIRPHLNPDWKFGFVGEPGDCKTVSAVKLVLFDFMLHGVKCFSNMHIKQRIVIPDDDPYCLALGIPGGEVVFESEELDKKALFRLDEQYRKCVIFVDEINLDMAEARRSTSNVNLNLNKVGQELRHLEAALIYTVISEMWVDARIRQLTDIFIRTEDTALDMKALQNKQTPGIKARWTVFSMSRKLNGSTYNKDTGAGKLGPYYVRTREMWDAYDTFEMQASESLKYGSFMKDSKLVVEAAPRVTKENDEWGWLKAVSDEILHSDQLWIPATEFYHIATANHCPKDVMTKELFIQYQIKNKPKYLNGKKVTHYEVPEESLVPA